VSPEWVRFWHFEHYAARKTDDHTFAFGQRRPSGPIFDADLVEHECDLVYGFGKSQ
jgi:hypothetical protein